MTSLSNHPFFAAFPGALSQREISPEEENPEVAVVIPARMGSTRFPGKPLAQVAGRPLIVRVAELARRSDAVDRVLIATDSSEILAVAEQYGVEAVRTSPSAHCGTDRVAEAAKNLTAGIVVNLQADELLGDPRMIDQAVAPLLADGRIPLATLRRRITSPEDITNPNIVKVIANQRNLALYFSRSPIPMDRDGTALQRSDIFWDQHLGIYAFRKAALLEFARLPVSALEETEKLEQLRALYYGFAIYVARTDFPSWRVDTPEDLAQIREGSPGGLPFSF